MFPYSLFYLTKCFADNPVNHFPTYQPSDERIAEINASLVEENNPLNIHYDASQEVRAKGAGFYQFSADEVTRRKEMEDLKKAREDTEKTREELGAVDVRPGEVEGMVQESEGVGEQLKKSRAMEKRKRELEERRKMLDAKRRKTNHGNEPPSIKIEVQEPMGPPAIVQAPLDPFAALEAQTPLPKLDLKGKGKMKEDPADAFLAALERDILKGTNK
ncbi:hypothetical protein QCA50_005888 [Cerrena zonata]|uniref:Uncharacterized protein n=1 Tax=Cerrena zonata TaxID=2478898 RepID=A0AAW0GB51_9APHY